MSFLAFPLFTAFMFWFGDKGLSHCALRQSASELVFPFGVFHTPLLRLLLVLALVLVLVVLVLVFHIYFFSFSVFCCLIICPDNCRYMYTYRSCFSYFAYCVVNERESFELQTAKWKSEKPHYHQKIFPKLTLKTRHVQMYIVHVHSRYTKKDNDTYAHTRTHAHTFARMYALT